VYLWGLDWHPATEHEVQYPATFSARESRHLEPLLLRDTGTLKDMCVFVRAVEFHEKEKVPHTLWHLRGICVFGICVNFETQGTHNDTKMKLWHTQ
jgi:hypothetical protein